MSSILVDFYNLNLESDWERKNLLIVSPIGRAKIRRWCFNPKDVFVEEPIYFVDFLEREIEQTEEFVRLYKPDANGLKRIVEFLENDILDTVGTPLTEEEKQVVSGKVRDIFDKLACETREPPECFNADSKSDSFPSPHRELLEYSSAVCKLRFYNYLTQYDDMDYSHVESTLQYLDSFDTSHPDGFGKPDATYAFDLLHNLNYLDTLVDYLKTVSGYEAIIGGSWFNGAEFVCFIELYRRIRALIKRYLSGANPTNDSAKWLNNQMRRYSKGAYNRASGEEYEIDQKIITGEFPPKQITYQSSLRWYVNLVDIFHKICKETIKMLGIPTENSCIAECNRDGCETIFTKQKGNYKYCAECRKGVRRVYGEKDTKTKRGYAKPIHQALCDLIDEWLDQDSKSTTASSLRGNLESLAEGEGPTEVTETPFLEKTKSLSRYLSEPRFKRMLRKEKEIDIESTPGGREYTYHFTRIKS